MFPTKSTILLISLACLINGTSFGQDARVPQEAVTAAKAFTLAKGIKAKLFAAEPMVANAVSIEVDDQGRVFVCETYRQDRGVEDNRNHEDWVNDDLASRTVEDRLKLLKKHLNGDLSSFAKNQDRIRLLQDRNGDGTADKSSVFVDGFRNPLDGTGAGVLSHNGTIYYTCIPKLYAFRDKNNDGRADAKSELFDGFGVRFAYRGHDLHGLTIGNDGRLYFSMGDRGYHVKSKEGKTFANPESGAIFRCEFDGSGLEVIATGLRNPQELAFDEYNNLFTCDNNSDSGDLARWLHILPGADYGWRMAFQYFGDRGPFNREKLWETRNSTQPAYVMPAIENMSDGPAGLAYYPGSGLSENYNGNFFLCDFRGQAGTSGIRTFKVKPNGASFEVIDPEIFLWNCLATDVDFGPDGSIYVSDWVQGWEGTGKGRIYRLFDEEKINSKISKEVKKLLAADFSRLNEKQLAALLSHVDRRIRRESQFELVRRGKVDVFATVLEKTKVLFTKLHCIWGLGQIGRGSGKNANSAMEVVDDVIQDIEPQIRYAAITAIGDARYAPSAKKVFKRLYDKSPRVQLAAAIATSRYQSEGATENIVEMIQENADADVTLRHAGALALSTCASRAQLSVLKGHENDDVRLATVLALRMKKSRLLTEFLNDKNERIAIEAALAIHDAPVQEGLPALAKLIEGDRFDDAMMRRVLSAHHHLGTAAHAERLARFAAESEAPLPLRQFALKLLNDWGSDNLRDPVIGVWRDWKHSRKSLDAIAAIRKNLPKLMTANHEIRGRSARLAAQFGITEVESQLKELLWKRDATGKERAGALLALATLEPEGLEEICSKAIRDNQPRVRAAGRIVLSQTNPDAAVDAVREALRTGTKLEKQSAVTLLPNIDRKVTDKALLGLMRLMQKNKIPNYLRLDVLEAAHKRAGASPPLKEQLLAYEKSFGDMEHRMIHFREAMHGGSAERGERLFYQRISLGCVKCHKSTKGGGRVGPDLSKIGAEKSREYLLESILNPNKAIAKGYETAIVTTDDGLIHSGIIQSQNDEELELITIEDKVLKFRKRDIEDITRGKSSMPANIIDYLNAYDLRDLIEYLSSLK